MDWASEHELPDQRKASHATVGYEHPAANPEYRCGNCANYIKSSMLGPARCRTVVQPIRVGDWCKRYREKEK